MLQVMVVDDELPARARIKRLLEDIQDELPTEVCAEAGNGAEALHLLLEQKVNAQVLLLDIHMPGMTGIELARHLLRMPAPPAVIFTTAHDDFALQAFEVHALDYLVKPIRAERLLAALRKARRLAPQDETPLAQLPQGARRHLVVNERGRVLLVAVDSIVYLKAELKYVTVRTADREFLLEESLTQLEQEFGPLLVRIHRNCLVARQAIAGFERGVGPDGEGHWEVVLHGVAERLAISRRQQHLVREFGR